MQDVHELLLARHHKIYKQEDINEKKTRFSQERIFIGELYSWLTNTQQYYK